MSAGTSEAATIANESVIVRTVLGDIPPSELGVVNSHEHVFWNGGAIKPYAAPTGGEERDLALAPVQLTNLWWVRQNFTKSRDNIQLTDAAIAVRELTRFVAAGGRAMVDPTPRLMGRDPNRLAEVSRATGIHLVMGTGYYVGTSHVPQLASTAEAPLEEEMATDVVEGADSTSIRSGLIGEIGCSWPITPGETRVLRAAGRVQRLTGAPLMIHPGRSPDAPLEHIRMVEEVGADPGRTIVAHVDQRIADHRRLSELARTGCYVAFDCFGLEPWLDGVPATLPTPCDLERIELVLAMMSAGFEDQILIASDISMKHRLTVFGGHGYDHVLRTVVPLLTRRGCQPADIDRLMIHNPRRALQMPSAPRSM